uniref:BSD domain-containing protein n=1 Tax=Globisporangium ultimum (strain ATCC 200006 / CBS 805.95 / DAOM BR144) TaxID=431595 RepID=K3WQI1_GLOUD
MSYNFYSLVSSIKDKSSQAMATLSSDLKEFTAIIQEDAAEVATVVRKTVQEKSEALRQRADDEEGEKAATEQEQVEHEDNKEDNVHDAAAKNKDAADSKDGQQQQEGEADSAHTASGSKLNSLFSSIGGYTLETSFGSLNLGEVGSKILHSADGVGSKLLHSADEVSKNLLHTADGILGSLASGNPEYTDDEDVNDDALAARRFRLLALQEDADTYLEPPMDAETFAKWKTATQSEELETVKAEVLEHYPAVVEKFTELVPSAIDAETFWMHYIYKASLLTAQEQRGADLLEHALNDSEEEIGWDVDSPRNEDSEGNKSGSVTFFPEEETKEDDREHSQPAPVVTTTANTADAAKSASTNSSSSDGGESWIELDERKDQQPPLSTSSSIPENKPASAATTAAGVKTATAAIDDEEELDWGDDDLIPEEVLSNDEASTAETVPAFHEEPKKRAGDWGEWD